MSNRRSERSLDRKNGRKKEINRCNDTYIESKKDKN